MPLSSHPYELHVLPISVFLLLGSYRRISLIPRALTIFRNSINFLRWGVVSISPNSQAGGPPLVGCPRLLIQYIRSYPPYVEAVPQPEDVPCRDDRDPLITACSELHILTPALCLSTILTALWHDSCPTAPVHLYCATVQSSDARSIQLCLTVIQIMRIIVIKTICHKHLIQSKA